MDDALLDGRYRPKRRLGAGGMGEVWLAHDERLDRYVAIKRVLLEGGADEQELLRLMRREAVISARLNHPHIVKIHDLLDVGGHPYLVMEYIEGESMADRLRRAPAPSPRDSARLVGQVASGLAVAHRHGVVHRDVKPHNILIDQEGVAKLADFGIARAIETMVTHGRGPAGTFAYMAPEIARTGEASPASDVWSLGATFFAATEGHPPHMPPGVQHIGEVFQRILTRDAPRPARAGDFGALTSAMLATDPARRPTMATVVEEMDRLRRAGRATDVPDPPPRRPPERTTPGAPEVGVDPVLSGRRDWRVPIAIVASVLVMALVVAGLVGYLLYRANEEPDVGPAGGASLVEGGDVVQIVEITADGFDPDGFTVAAGEVVQFEVVDDNLHALVVGDLDYQNIGGTDLLNYRFAEPGTYLVRDAAFQTETRVTVE